MYKKRNNFARLTLVFWLFAACISVFAEQRTHLVMPSQTLYSISKLYGVTIEALQAANPTLIQDTYVAAGALIVIPDAETSTSTTNKTEPHLAEKPVIELFGEAVAEKTNVVFNKVKDYVFSFRDASNIAVILPFNLESHNTTEDKVQMRSVEFYQGFLLAVNDAQRMGKRLKIQTYDLSTTPLNLILANPRLVDANLIIAPMEANDVRMVASFGEKHDIPVLSPFAYCADLVASCPHLYQLNTATSSIYMQINQEIERRFKEYAYVFVADSLFVDNKDAYPLELQRYLTERGVPFYQTMYGSPESVERIDTLLNLQHQNILYIPLTSQKDAMHRFFPSLKNKYYLQQNPEVAEAIGQSVSKPMVQMGDGVIEGERQVAILGYPKWQSYTDDFMESFYDLNVWMFTKFYVNPFKPEVQDFYNQFRYWYGREPMNIYPKYAMLGYDVANFCLDRLEKPSSMSGDAEMQRSLQSAIRFEQEGEGCYQNKAFYFVHFTPDTTIEVYENQ